jgi:PAS domain S-box-containing protein
MATPAGVDLLEIVSDTVILLDRQWRYVYLNRAAEQLAGTPRAELIGRVLWETYPGLLGTAIEAAYRKAMEERVAVSLEAQGVVSGRWYDIHVYPAQDGLLVYGRDVTRRKDAERALQELNATLEQRVGEQTAALVARAQEIEAAQSHYRELAEHNRRLARELEHRVGNHLAGLRALVREMRQRGADAEHLARAMEDRLVALAQVHRLLTVEGWGSVQVRALADSLFQALRPAAPHPCPSKVEGPDVAVDSSQATALAMILTEWFTNSCKYGVHSAAGGRVEVCWQLLGGGKVGNGEIVRLTWTERGGPPIASEPMSSLGTELVRGFSTRELRGRCEMNFPREGAEHWLEFPVRESSGREIDLT